MERTKFWPQEKYPIYLKILNRCNNEFKYRLNNHLALNPNFEPVIHKGKIWLSHDGILSTPFDGDYGLKDVPKFYKGSPEFTEYIKDFTPEMLEVLTDKTFIHGGKMWTIIDFVDEFKGVKYFDFINGKTYQYRFPFNKYKLPMIFTTSSRGRGMSYEKMTDGSKKYTYHSRYFEGKIIEFLWCMFDYKHPFKWHFIKTIKAFNYENTIECQSKIKTIACFKSAGDYVFGKGFPIEKCECTDD